MALDPAQRERLQDALIEWFGRYGRDLPWRHTRDPYAVLVSEMMLQQTQVERVMPKWHAWLQQFPTLNALAAAARADVIRAWQGLGYNLRAVRLHQIAVQCVAEFGGELPRTVEGLLSLGGIGPYTAGAVACFAYEQPVAMVDTNVRRVLGRVVLGEPAVPRGHEKRLAALAQAMVPVEQSWEWNQALMDLGATICLVERPACLVCPLRDDCRAAPAMGAWPEQRRQRLKESRASYNLDRRRAADQQRFLRGKIVEALRAQPPGAWLNLAALRPLLPAELLPDDPSALERTIQKLADNGLLFIDRAVNPARVRLPD